MSVHHAQKGQLGGVQLLGRPITTVGEGGPHVGDHGGTAADRHPLTIFDGQTGCQQVPLELFLKMVPSVPGESARIVDMHFCVKGQTLLVDPNQMEPYFEVTISNSYS